MSAPWSPQLPRSGPSGPDAPDAPPSGDSLAFDAARRAGFPRPRPRCAARPPVYARCPHCGEWAPEAQAFETRDGGEMLRLTGCLRCIAQQIEEAA